MLLSLVYRLVRCLFGPVAVLARSDLSKDAELLVLRRQLGGRVRWEHADRLWLAALSRLVGRRWWPEVFPVTPAPRTWAAALARCGSSSMIETLILNEHHLALVLREYVTHYNAHRPHQSRRQRPPDIATQPVQDVADLRSVHRKPVVTGLINEYHQTA